MGAEVCIQVFAKAPVVGACKTRLIPVLGAEAAAALQKKLLQHCLHNAIEARIGPVQLWCAPASTHEFFGECAARFGVTLHDQLDADLGARMAHALAAALMEFNSAILIGSDCPALNAEHLRTAASVLRDGTPAVITPVEDGGYVLIGLSKLDCSLFNDITWSSAQVMSTTRTRLQALGWAWHELPTLWDVDRAEDYARLQREGWLAECSAAARPA